MAVEDFIVTLLGTGVPSPTLDRFGASALVQAGPETLLFDCGRGALQRIYQLNVSFQDARLLFLTHLHTDHSTGIPDLWLTPPVFASQRVRSIRCPTGVWPGWYQSYDSSLERGLHRRQNRNDFR